MHKDIFNQILLPGVAAVIFNEAGEILLQMQRHIDRWCIITGRPAFGESMEQAILREIEAVTNTPAVITDFIGVYSSPCPDLYNGKTTRRITLFFEAKLAGGLCPYFSNNKAQELRFFQPENIPEALATPDPNWLRDAVNNHTLK